MEEHSRKALVWGVVGGGVVQSLFLVFGDGLVRAYSAGFVVAMVTVLVLIFWFRATEKRVERLRMEAEAENEQFRARIEAGDASNRYYDDLSWLRYRDDG